MPARAARFAGNVVSPPVASGDPLAGVQSSCAALAGFAPAAGSATNNVDGFALVESIDAVVKFVDWPKLVPAGSKYLSKIGEPTRKLVPPTF